MSVYTVILGKKGDGKNMGFKAGLSRVLER